MQYLEYFGMKQRPFSNNLKSNDLLRLPGMVSVKERVDYLLNAGGVMVVTGDIGSGKSTSLRWSVDQYHKSEVMTIVITASTGSIIELYKQLCWGLNIKIYSSNKVSLVKVLKETIQNKIVESRSKLLIIIDEASLLRTDLLAELHTLTQFNLDSQNLFSLILAGQNSLLDKLRYRVCEPLASRVLTRSHLTAISRDQMIDYLQHHLNIAGIKKQLFSDSAITGIYQGSGGLLRRANALAQGALVACMIDGENEVSDEHVRRASSELI